MPLDLPPPLPPQQAEVAVLEQRHAAADGRDDVIELGVGQYSLLVSGNSYLSEDRIREVASAGKTPSQAILLLNALYPAEGYPLVNVQYARESGSNTIYVRINEGYLADVDAPPLVEPFFESLEDRRDLRESDFEAMRVLAELKSERAGYDLSTKYTVNPSDPEKFRLVIEGGETPDHDSLEFSTTFGNPGNRFLGRYFGVGSAKYSAPNGDQISLGYARAFPNLGTSRGGEGYDRYDASYTTVNPYGLYGLSASYTEYEVTDLLDGDFNDTEEAEIIEGKFTGNQFIYADGDTRLVLEQEVGYVDSTIEITEGQAEADQQESGLLGGLLGDLLETALGIENPEPGTMVDLAGQTIQDEAYGHARIGATLSHSWKLFGQSGSLSTGAGYRRGFGGEIDNNLTDPERTADFGVYDADFTVRYRLPWELIASLNGKGQFASDDRLPQQQQWVLGGPDNLSAFLPGVMIGDTGAYGRLALQLPRWRLFSRPYRFSVFVEAGMSEFEGPNPPAGREDRESASDAGVKLEFAPFDNVTLTAHAADTLSTSGLPEERERDAETDVFFNLEAKF